MWAQSPMTNQFEIRRPKSDPSSVAAGNEANYLNAETTAVLGSVPILRRVEGRRKPEVRNPKAILWVPGIRVSDFFPPSAVSKPRLRLSPQPFQRSGIWLLSLLLRRTGRISAFHPPQYWNRG